MQDNQAKELDFTVQLLNYAKAIYQGRFAMLNVFKQLGHPLFKPAELDKTKPIIEQVNSWLEEALAQRLIFSFVTPTAEQTKVIVYLKSAKPELESLAKKVKAILVSQTHFTDNNDAIFLLAVQGNFTYFQDNFLQGISRVVKSSGTKEFPAGLIQAIRSASENTTQLNQLVAGALQNGNEVEKRHFARLAFICRNLAGNLRTLKTDLNQMVLGPNELFDFRAAEFLQAEGESWGQAGFNPVAASYWRAHEFGIEDSLNWINTGINNPAIAAEWKTAGFLPEQAVMWMSVLFPPLLAIQWANAGYHPQQAAILLNSGFGLPEQVPADQVNEILESEIKKLNAMAEQNQRKAVGESSSGTVSKAG